MSQSRTIHLVVLAVAALALLVAAFASLLGTDASEGTLVAAVIEEPVDTVPPVVTAPADILEEATSPAGADVTYSGESATDDVSGSVPVSCAPASGSTFPLGDTTVTCTATDLAGNIGEASFTVTVVDTTPPGLTVPGPITEEATGPDGDEVTFDVTATDAVTSVPLVSCVPSSGSTFPLGTTLVECEATDDALNSNTAQFIVTVEDTTPPDLVIPELITEEATGPDGAPVDFDVSATDAVDPNPLLECDATSGDTFPLGNTIVTCTASDSTPILATLTLPQGIAALEFVAAPTGNSVEDSFTIRVVDTTGPAITVPDDITAEATGPDGAVVDFTPPAAEDLVQGPVPVSCSHESGDTFPLGQTLVFCSANDVVETNGIYETADLVIGPPIRGNFSYAEFLVTVVDTTPPDITVPDDITAEATGPDGAVVTFVPPTATDVVDPDPEFGCDAASGDTFPLGTTVVTCTATDAEVGGPIEQELEQKVAFLGYENGKGEAGVSGNNTSTATFTVTVVDTTPPDLTVADDTTVEATGPDGAPVEFDAPTATDLVDPDPDTNCDAASGDTFPLGTTVVTCTATDGVGSVAAASTAALDTPVGNVTTATFTVTVVDTIAPVLDVPETVEVAATSIAGAVVDYPAVTATDAVTTDPAVTCDEPSGSTFDFGDTTVTCTAADAAGNVGSASFTVTVTGDPDLLGAGDAQDELGASGAPALRLLLLGTGLLGLGLLLTRRSRTVV